MWVSGLGARLWLVGHDRPSPHPNCSSAAPDLPGLLVNSSYDMDSPYKRSPGMRSASCLLTVQEVGVRQHARAGSLHLGQQPAAQEVLMKTRSSNGA